MPAEVRTQTPQLVPAVHVRPVEAHRRKALSEGLLEPGGYGRTGKAGHQRAQREATHVRRCLHQPFTAPPTRPLVIRPCTSRKKMITGTATSVEAAMTWPQSVSRVALACTNPRSHSGSVSAVARHDHQGDSELVPGLQEGEHGGGHQAGGQQRERDPQEGARCGRGRRPSPPPRARSVPPRRSLAASRS